MKAVETVVHLERESPARLKTMVPEHVVHLVRPYGLAGRARPESVARPDSTDQSA
jgi:coenzyme F420 hydrogenase subunit beta